MYLCKSQYCFYIHAMLSFGFFLRWVKSGISRIRDEYLQINIQQYVKIHILMEENHN